MPPRSNDFQQLIVDIERQLAGAGATVTESAMLRDFDGSPKEVDVLVEVPAGVRTVRWAVECRDHKRRVTREWIETLVGRFAHLDVDRVIAVSRSGFTAGARRTAVHHGIETWTLREAIQADWARGIREIGSVSFTLTPTVVPSMNVVLAGTVSPDVLRAITDQTLVGGEGRQDPCTLPQLAYLGLAMPDIRPKVDAFFAANPEGTFILRMMLPGWWVQVEGVRYPLRRATAAVRRERHEGAVNLTQARYEGGSSGQAAVAYGEGQVGPLRLRVVTTATPGREGPLHVTVDTTRGR